MIFPLYPLDLFGHATGQVLGVLCGVAFGFVLERAGFGQASNLAAQFYGRDNRVLKVMFTGIATTAASLGLLSAVGLLDLSLLTVPETHLWPQLVGGLLLGVGFVVAGYCPGTGVVAAASGSIDGMLAYLGVMLGSLVFGLAWPAVGGFYESGAMGSVRFDQLLGVPFAVVAAGVVAMAVGAFFAVERLEAWLAGRRGTTAPDVDPHVRNRVFVALAAMAVVAIVPSMMPKATARALPPDVSTIDALTLAGRVVREPRSLWIVDLRDPAVCARASVPGAVCRTADDADGKFVLDLPTSRLLVVVTDTELPETVRHWGGPIVVLDGGYAAFQDQVLTAPTLPADATLAQVESYQRRAALQAWFTGSAAPAAAPVVVKKAASGAPAKKGGGC